MLSWQSFIRGFEGPHTAAEQLTIGRILMALGCRMRRLERPRAGAGGLPRGGQKTASFSEGRASVSADEACLVLYAPEGKRERNKTIRALTGPGRRKACSRNDQGAVEWHGEVRARAE